MGSSYTRRPPAPSPCPRQRQEGETDLDLLLVVVDLPGNVNMHSTPLPWFLEQEGASVVRRKTLRENPLPFAQSVRQVSAAGAFFIKGKCFVPFKCLLSAAVGTLAGRCHSELRPSSLGA